MQPSDQPVRLCAPWALAGWNGWSLAAILQKIGAAAAFGRSRDAMHYALGRSSAASMGEARHLRVPRSGRLFLGLAQAVFSGAISRHERVIAERGIDGSGLCCGICRPKPRHRGEHDPGRCQSQGMAGRSHAVPRHAFPALGMSHRPRGSRPSRRQDLARGAMTSPSMVAVAGWWRSR